MDTFVLLAKSLLTVGAGLYLAFMVWLLYWLRKCSGCDHKCNNGWGCKRVQEQSRLVFHHGIAEVGAIGLPKE